MVLAPTLFAVLAFATGVLLLWSLAVPTLPEEFARTASVLTSAAVNASHFFGSLVGVFLLLLGAGLRRRSRTACWLTILMLSVSVVFDIVLRAPWQESAVLAGVAIALFASRGAFYRRGNLSDALADRGWIAAALLAFATFVWLGLILFEEVPYSDDLWWRFVLEDSGAPRFLRAAAGGAVLLAILVIWRAIAPATLPQTPPAIDAPRLRSVLNGGNYGHPDANLAWLGDKYLFWSATGRTFLQYGVRGRRLIVMGEPYGEAAEILPLLRDFRDFADGNGMAMCFYSVGPGLLPALIELGLIVQKMGETALLPLADFSLEGSHRKPLRQTHRRAEREGLAFRVVPEGEVPALIPRLRAISDDWLSHHEGDEKTFSLGHFDEAYLSRFPIAVVEDAEGPIAFANIWRTAGGRELSADLMRHREDTPRGTMDFLFIELAQWGRAEGFTTLDLGMAPLSGLEEDRLAPLLSQVGAFAYEHGGRFYGFQGLRTYKEKFAPVWQPLYLAAPTRLSLPLALADVALLTSGGLRGMIGKR
jgi:lysylphosphatidylglycerol synthetase-like protein (DUF2156 family)